MGSSSSCGFVFASCGFEGSDGYVGGEYESALAGLEGRCPDSSGGVMKKKENDREAGDNGRGKTFGSPEKENIGCEMRFFNRHFSDRVYLCSDI